MFNFLKNISPIEIGAIILVLVIIFGAGFVLRLGRAGGQTFREIKRVKKTFTAAVDDADLDKISKTDLTK